MTLLCYVIRPECPPPGPPLGPPPGPADTKLCGEDRYRPDRPQDATANASQNEPLTCKYQNIFRLQYDNRIYLASYPAHNLLEPHDSIGP